MLFSVANSRKACDGGLAGLHDAAVMAKKKAEEKALREAVAKNPELKDLAGAWDTIAEHSEGPRRQRRALQPARRRPGLQHARCSASPAPWSARPRNGQAQRRTPRGVRRRRTGVARSASCSRSGRFDDDFEIVKLGRLARLAVPSNSATTTRWCRRSSPASRRTTRAVELINGTKLARRRSSARSCTRAARRPSTPRRTR